MNPSRDNEFSAQEKVFAYEQELKKATDRIRELENPVKRKKKTGLSTRSTIAIDIMIVLTGLGLLINLVFFAQNEDNILTAEGKIVATKNCTANLHKSPPCPQACSICDGRTLYLIKYKINGETKITVPPGNRKAAD